ncbi:ribosome biogenesis protein bop1-B-like [Haliotis rufescens]|uniref:ribosome biogenesis protein bop1-B-like n=1 Tax=Haliotis rufescens TaxID=6454 RepID=UPI00201E8F14|nr:ribosome biogenesis protein bop1-B-like [Haliotis rufescens]
MFKNMATKRKHVVAATEEITDNSADILNKHASDDGRDDEGFSDTTDSEESVYSGLEDEEDTSDEEPEDESDEENEDRDADGRSEGEGVAPRDETESTPSGSAAADQVPQTDEYEHDSSDEEDIRNTVGNIPMEWYREYPHIGYDILGRRLIKPKKGDELDEFLNKVDDPDYWRTVTNKLTGQNVVLSKEDLDLINNIQRSRNPMGSETMFQPWIEYFTNETMIHPVTAHPAQKRSFIPSKWEKLKVGQMVHAIKMGWMKPPKVPDSDEEEKEEPEEEQPTYFNIWKDDEEPEITRRYRQHIPAPKMSLPGHEESYNPPSEYLLTEDEEKKWQEQEPEDRRLKFLPQKYSSLRLVPGFARFIQERFERCLDLYLCPRQKKIRMNVNPEDLIPKLPKPKELQPFPTTQSVIYRGHEGIVRCISVEPSGQWLASGCDDKTVRLWEVATGRCMKTLQMGEKVKSLAWNPNPALCLVAVVLEQSVVVVNPGLGDKLIVSNTDTVVAAFQPPQEEAAGKKVPVEWELCTGKEHQSGFRLRMKHPKEVSYVTWHGKGDYLATVMPKGDSMSVLIHQLSKRRSQNPFSKSKGLVQKVAFHPIRPYLFVATQRYVRVYNLLKQELTKKLMTNCKWVSSMAVHPGGDNVIVGSYDSRLSWFDLDLSTKPYNTLRHHKKAIRQVCYHRKYPLFASASDDGSLIVCHGMVYNDLLQNPLIVPVKVLKGHVTTGGLSVLDCEFHPTQPWVFSSGADATIRLYT